MLLAVIITLSREGCLKSSVDTDMDLGMYSVIDRVKHF